MGDEREIDSAGERERQRPLTSKVDFERGRQAGTCTDRKKDIQERRRGGRGRERDTRRKEISRDREIPTE